MSVNGEERDLKKSNKKQVFSFRAAINDICIWKAYVTARGMKMEDIATDAMKEYLKKHKLSETEQIIFNALIDRNADR